MKSTVNDGTITVKLSGRIDSGNADAVRKKLFELLEKDKAESVILDAEKLEYISSAGLRVILQLKKDKPDSKVINVSPEIYEIFETTGFTDIIETRKILRKISVDGCEKIGEGGFGTVYRLDPDTIVKVYKASGYDEIKRSMGFVKQAFVKGLPTAITFDIVKCGDKYGVVYELVQSDTVSDAIKKNPERFDEYVGKFVQLAKTMQTVAFEPGTLMNANDAFRDGFTTELKDALTPEEMSELVRLFDAIPKRNTLLHNDLHTRNAMIQGDELLLIDMDDLMCGHPIYDIGKLYFVYTYLPKSGAGRSEMLLGLDPDTCEKFINKFTELYFAGLAPEEADKAVKAAVAFGNCTSSYHGRNASGVPHEMWVQMAAKVLKGAVLPNVDLIIDALPLIARQ